VGPWTSVSTSSSARSARVHSRRRGPREWSLDTQATGSSSYRRMKGAARPHRWGSRTKHRSTSRRQRMPLVRSSMVDQPRAVHAGTALPRRRSTCSQRQPGTLPTLRLALGDRGGAHSCRLVPGRRKTPTIRGRRYGRHEGRLRGVSQLMKPTTAAAKLGHLFCRRTALWSSQSSPDHPRRAGTSCAPTAGWHRRAAPHRPVPQGLTAQKKKASVVPRSGPRTWRHHRRAHTLIQVGG